MARVIRPARFEIVVLALLVGLGVGLFLVLQYRPPPIPSLMVLTFFPVLKVLIVTVGPGRGATTLRLEGEVLRMRMGNLRGGSMAARDLIRVDLDGCTLRMTSTEGEMVLEGAPSAHDVLLGIQGVVEALSVAAAKARASRQQDAAFDVADVLQEVRSRTG